MQIPELQHLLVTRLPQRLKDRISSVLSEDDAYAADELVELGEEILNQIAAAGVVHYLQTAPQKEVYNDFLLQLFNSSGHDYNAGPLFRWSANMIRECPAIRKSAHFSFYWEIIDGAEKLAVRVNGLGELRNAVMHGFFVLPPERNRAEAVAMAALMEELLAVNFFDRAADYHFFRAGAFTGRWNITEPSEWSILETNTAFGSLASRIILERTEEFWNAEAKRFEENAHSVQVSEQLKSFVNLNTRGAYALWLHPADPEAAQKSAAIVQHLKSLPDTVTVSYGLNPTGLTYTSSFLMNRLLKVLDLSGKPAGKNKKAEERLKSLRKEFKGKVIVFIDRVHTALFSAQHVTRLKDVLYENNILLIATGHHYRHFDSFFNASETAAHPPVIPAPDARTEDLQNYLRFKGPFADRKEDLEEVNLLRKILDHVCDALAQDTVVIARRFADTHGYPMEYVHEVFALLEPWVHVSRKPFEEDTLDELYGFPSVTTETTAIYLALGRRDLKLEYQHKILSL